MARVPPANPEVSFTTAALGNAVLTFPGLMTAPTSLSLHPSRYAQNAHSRECATREDGRRQGVSERAETLVIRHVLVFDVSF